MQKISEGKMFLLAFGLMISLSSLVGGVLYFSKAGPLAVVIGATVSGVVAYVLVCMRYAPLVIKPLVQDDRD